MARAMSLRRSAISERGKKSKGWRGGFRDRFAIPKAEGAWIMLCPGEYLDERPDQVKENGGEAPTKHYDARKFHTMKWNEGRKEMFRKSSCQTGWSADCTTSCLPGLLKSEGDRRISDRTLFSLNILHLGLYQMEELTDGKGKARLWERDDPDGKHKRGDPIVGWMPITRARDLKETLEEIDDLLDEGAVKMWSKKYIEVGSNHLQNVMVIDDEARKHCMCGGKLEPVVFTCPKCEEVICDVVDANMTADERDRYALSKQRCDDCGCLDFPDMEHVCDECDEPEPLNAFQVVAKVRRQGEGTASTIRVEEVMPVWEFEFDDGTGLLDLDDDDDIQFDDDDNLVFRPELQKLVFNQFDFDKVHRPMTNAYVAKLLDVDNTIDGDGDSGGGGGGAQSYKKGRGRNDSDSGSKKSRGRKRARPRSRR